MNLHVADGPRSRPAAPPQESLLSDVKANWANELERRTSPEDRGETEMFCVAEAITETRRAPIQCSLGTVLHARPPTARPSPQNSCAVWRRAGTQCPVPLVSGINPACHCGILGTEIPR